MAKTKVVLPDKTEANAHYGVSVAPEGNIAAGYQKVLKDDSTGEEVNDGEFVNLKLTPDQEQAITDALDPVMTEIITADQAAKIGS